MNSFLSFETERLVLRPTNLDDAAFVLELLNSPKWLKYIGDRNVKTIEDAQNYISSKIHPQLHKLGFANYTVILKSDGSKIGSCGLYDREGLEGVDLGFAFLPKFERKGYGFESSSRILDAAFENFGMEQLGAITSKENFASQGLLIKLGFAHKKMIILPGDKAKLMYYEIIRPNS